MDLSAIASTTTSITTWPATLFVVVAIGILSALDTFRSGSNRSVALSLSLPLSAFLVAQIPNTAFLSNLSQQLSSPSLQGIEFGVVFVLTLVLVHRIISPYNAGGSGIFLAALTGAATAVIFAVSWLAIPSLLGLYPLNGTVELIFGESYRLFWILAGYLVFAFVRA